MTRITLPDDLVKAVDQAFLNEEIEAVVERLLRQEVAKRQRRSPEEVERLLAEFETLRAQFPTLSNDEIRRLRQDGRP